MEKLPNGSVVIVNVPGTPSLLIRAWHLYTKHFWEFSLFSLLFAIGVLVNAGLGVLFDFLERSGGVGTFALSRFGITIANIFVAYYAAWIFCGCITFLNQLRHGRSATVVDSLKQGSERLNSVFWVAALLAFILYGSLFTGILFVIFSFWYYFALYVVLVDEERGLDAIAKSRYLTHGLFWKIFGRYIAILLILFALYTICYLLLGITGALGPYLFIASTFAVAFFSLPFFIIYDFIRFIDIAAVDRNLPFARYRGERMALGAWSLFGGVLFALFWVVGLLMPQTQSELGRSFGLSVTRALLPIAERMQENLGRVGDMFGFERPEPRPDTELDDLKRILDQDGGTQ